MYLNVSNPKNETVFGGEVSTIFRIAKMNMILAGDGHSNIARQDSYEKKQTNKLDVVITNIPFGNKMKTDYLSQYGYNGKSAEICGVLHCLDALNNQNENARAGIIVPEGILFNGNKAYTQLRRDLVEKYSLENVVSLPKRTFVDVG
ncbi:restriction-modification protein, partial [Reticulomyxa filosa]